MTTGGSTRETMQVASAAGAQVVGAASMVDRSGGRCDLDVPFHGAAAISRCRLTRPSVPAVRAGRRLS